MLLHLMVLLLLPQLLLSMSVSIASQTASQVTSRSVRLVTFPMWRSGGFGSLDNTPIGNHVLGSGADADVAGVTPIWDADSYRGRQRLYDAAMQASPMSYGASKLTCAEASDNDAFGGKTLHFLAGFMGQLEWQQRSGRLAFGGGDNVNNITGEDNDAISPQSWWGRTNFALCVPIVVGAERAGLTLPFKCADIQGSCMDYLPAYEESGVVEVWTKVFERIALSDRYDELEIDDLRGQIWAAHMTSLEIALPLSEQFFAMLPPEEKVFGTGWIRFVDILAASRLRTDIAAINNDGSGYLPRSMLGIATLPPSSASASSPELESPQPLQLQREAATLAATLDLAESTQWSYDLSLGVVKTICRQYEARRRFSTIIRAILFRQEDPRRCGVEVLRLLGWLLKSASEGEGGGAQ